MRCGPVVQLVRTLACHARGREFEPHPGRHAAIAQSVERILGKDEVSSSNLDSSLHKSPCRSFGLQGLLLVHAAGKSGGRTFYCSGSPEETLSLCFKCSLIIFSSPSDEMLMPLSTIIICTVPGSGPFFRRAVSFSRISFKSGVMALFHIQGLLFAIVRRKTKNMPPPGMKTKQGFDKPQKEIYN